MSKKILSVVLALVLVMTTFAVCAFAVGGTGYEDEDSTYTQTWALGEPVDNGNGTWSVDVMLTANYYVGAISFVVTNDNPAAAVLKSVTKGAALTYEANIQKNATTGLVAIIPEPIDESEKGVDLTAGGVIATLTYTLADGASAQLAIANDPKTATTPGGDLIAVRLSDNNLTTATMIYGQTVTSVGASVKLGNAAVAADPVLSGVDTGVVDAENGYVYGVPAGADANAYFAVADGSFEIEGTFTGATLVVKTADGAEFATYTLIIFGDVDGNGAITAADSTVAKMAALGGGVEGGAACEFAADVDGNGEITAADSTVIKMAALGGDITVNPYAA